MTVSDRPARSLPVPPGLVEAFWAHQRALQNPHAPGDGALASDALRVGDRGPAGPEQRVVRTHVQVIDSAHALVVAVTETTTGGCGEESQLWAYDGHRWTITAAHRSDPPPALDTRIWRVVGDPLVPGAPQGPLRGESVAVKDVFAVAGQQIGAGNPTWQREATLERRDARVVETLIEAGADLRGIARTSELTLHLDGSNPHTGTPPNPRAPGRLPGGSTSGSATAVSLGHASIGLGTDSTGSIRVPAAYQGLFGFRPTLGAIPLTGTLTASPTVDTVGWLTRSATLLADVGRQLLPASPTGGGTDLVIVPEILGWAHPEVATPLESWVADRGLVIREGWPLGQVTEWLGALAVLYAWESWHSWGPAFADRPETLGPAAREHLEFAAQVDEASAAEAHTTVDLARTRLRELVGDRILALPTTSSTAPRVEDGLRAVQERTARLTSLASLAGLPTVTVPLRSTEGLPCGVSLMAGAGRDLELLEFAVQVSR